MDKEIIKEIIVKVKEEFDLHLSIPDNNRVIFSGKYGIGKTTFLNYYFENKAESYNVVKLNPIDYSIASNEDVFKYIKYDILYHLLEQGMIDFENFDFSKIETASHFLEDNILDVFATFLPLIPKFGGDIKDVYDGVKGLGEKYSEFHAKMTTNHDESELDLFMKELITKEGSLYENNIITEIIQNTLSELRREDSKNILIIDDLDRIDPHHIFRLFNVFAAHLNTKEDVQNKFGFDRVVFVCDIENIRNIFKNRYGADVDFNGYIDKFYSKKIFYYNAKEEIESYARILIDRINFKFEEETLQQNWGTGNHGRPEFVRELMKIVPNLILSNQLNLRQLLKDKKLEHVFNNKTVQFSRTRGINNDRPNWSLTSILVIDFLSSLLGEKNSLIEALEASINRNETETQLLNKGLSNILALTNFREHKFQKEFAMKFDFGHKIEVEAVLVIGGRAGYAYVEYNTQATIGVPSGVDDKLNYNLFNLYIEGIKILDELNYKL